MLAKQNRLTRKDFSKHFKQGKRIHSPVATLIVSLADSFHGSVVVSKKVHKKAVRRNLLRRRAYAQLYRAYKDNKVGVFILVLKPALVSLSRHDQHQKIAELIDQAQ